MVQEILTYIVVAYAFFYTLRGAYQLIKQSKTATSCSGGGLSCGCSAKTSLLSDIKAGKKPFLLTHGEIVKPPYRIK